MTAHFAPRRVVDVDVRLDTPLSDLLDLHPGTAIFALVHFHGAPVGTVEIPIPDGRCPASRITREVIDRCEGPIVERLLVRALERDTLHGSAKEDGFADLMGERPDNNPLPSLTVAVCSRDRTPDLDRCLSSIERIDYPGIECLVVDNASLPGETQGMVRSRHPGVRYVHEPCPGLNWARRRAVQTASGEIVAFVDDDVTVDQGWARAIGRAMADNPDVMAVTGLVLPFEIETGAQLRFEQLGGLSKGFVRRWHRRRLDRPAASTVGNTGPLGIGANMAFRASIFGSVGLFDPALGAGTITGGGDDLDMFFRVLHAGHTLLYDPSVVVRHRHRATADELTRQLKNWCMGTQAYLVRNMRAFPEERAALAGLSARLLGIYYPRRLAQSLVDPSIPTALAWAEWRGGMTGLFRYQSAMRHARDLARRFGYQIDARSTSPPPGGRPMRSARELEVNLDEPLPDVLPGPDDSDVVRLHVTRNGSPIGTVPVVAGGHPISRVRASGEIVAALGRRRLDPADRFGRAVRASRGLG